MRRSTVAFMLIGMWLVLAPSSWGWDALATRLQGGEMRLSRFFVGFAFVIVAYTLVEKARMKAHMAEILDALNRLVYGKEYAKHREAVDILVQALYGSSEEVAKKALGRLQMMTGQTFGDDPDAWRDWWRDARKNFRLQKKRDENES